MTSPGAKQPLQARRGSPPASAPRSRPSLERRLPLIITALLAILLASGLALTYATLRAAARETASARLGRAGEQLGSLARASIARIERGVAETAAHEAMPRALRGNAAALDAARARLGTLLTPGDSGLTVELWSAAGRRVAFAGADIRARGAPTGGESAHPAFGDALETLARSDSAEIGSLYLENGVVHFWVVAPVVAGDARLGFVARQYRIDDGDSAEQTIRALTGADVGTYYRNADGGLWTTLGGRVAAPPDGRDSTGEGLVVTRADVGELLAFEQPIAGSPLVLVLELPLRAALAAPRETIARLGLLSLLLLLVGAFGAWLVSRRITHPLATLTAAAEALAAGDYGVRVEPAGDDELARLGASFNYMAAEVGTTRDELEMQSEEAQAAAEELEESNAQLGGALQSLREARDAAEAANRAKSDFLAVMSHELRTPLNAIGGYAELLELGIRGPVTDEQRHDLERIRASQQHLLGLISGVLDMSRIEAGRVAYDLEPTLVDPFLEEIVGLVAPLAATKTLSLEHADLAPGLAVLADREKLRQILLNLLSNAIRHTPPHGRITVAAEERGDCVALTTRDTGTGIAADALERIFEPFVQLDRSLTRVREGIGLGLSISRDLARGMGGEITVESAPGEGACFTLTLPGASVDEGDGEAVALRGEEEGRAAT